MVHGADIVGHQLGLRQIGRTFQSHGKRMEPRPVGSTLGIILDAVGGKALGDGRDDRRVETAGKQHAIGHVTHQLTADGRLE